MGLCLDFKPNKYSRKLRARCGLTFLFAATIGVWVGSPLLSLNPHRTLKLTSPRRAAVGTL